MSALSEWAEDEGQVLDGFDYRNPTERRRDEREHQLEAARALGVKDGHNAAVSHRRRVALGVMTFGRPEPTLSGLDVVVELDLPIAAGDVDARYDLREAYRAGFVQGCDETTAY
jgi:hypothetical protein